MGWVDGGAGRVPWEGHLQLRRLPHKAYSRAFILRRPGWSQAWVECVCRERPEAAPSRCYLQTACSIEGETEAQRGNALVRVTEHIRQSQGWQLGLVPCAGMYPLPPGTVPKHHSLQEVRFEKKACM